MHEKEKDIIGAFLRGDVDRRDLLKGLGAAGLAAGTAGGLLNAMQTQALAADFDWKKHKGKKVKLLLNKHPYADAMIANLPAFKELTGIEIVYDVFPEDVYFDKVTAALSSGSSEYDAFMTGAYMTWTYGPAGWIADLNEWISDPAKTNPNYNWNDFLPGVKNSCAWNGKPGGALGSKDAKQWCIPWAFEQNNITYNRAMFDKAGVQLPKNLDDMAEVAAKLQKDIGGIYGIGLRGSRSWATIHPGFLSGYANFNEKDMNVSADGKLSAAMNTPGSRAYHEKFVKLVQNSGPKDWSTYTWYQVGTDLGAGASAMIFDADCLGYFMNGGGNKMAGQLHYADFIANPQAKSSTPNIWIWSLAMSNFSKDKDATWYFMQWATGPEHAIFGATKMDFVDPVRQSVWKDASFQEKLAKKYPGYLEMFNAAAGGASIKFTAQPLFFDVTTEWAATLQKMVAKQVSVDEGLDQLAQNINKQLKEAGLG